MVIRPLQSNIDFVMLCVMEDIIASTSLWCLQTELFKFTKLVKDIYLHARYYLKYSFLPECFIVLLSFSLVPFPAFHYFSGWYGKLGTR